MAQSTDFETLVNNLRPDLLRYCARMVGSVVDAEDVVQEALTRAYGAFPAASNTNLRGWLFRIAHNKAVDHLRRARQETVEYLDEQGALQVNGEPGDALEERELVTLALSVFLRLTPKQRSCVILKDVLGYSLAEIAELLDATLPDIKGALHRGRERLRELAGKVDPEIPLPLDTHERDLLTRYAERFNARDFDAVRALLTDEVRLDLVHREQRRGAAVRQYFENYAARDDWYLTVGMVDNYPALLVSDPRQPDASPRYWIRLTWDGDHISEIRDYRYATALLADAQLTTR